MFRRVARTAATARPWRSIPTPKALNPPPRAHSRGLRTRSSELYVEKSDGLKLQLQYTIPALLAGLVGVGVGAKLVTYSDSNKEDDSLPAPEISVNMEEMAQKQQQQIHELFEGKGIRRDSCPKLTISVKEQQVSIKFQIPPACEPSELIANIASHLGVKVEKGFDRNHAWQLMLTHHPEKKKGTRSGEGVLKDVNTHERDLLILISGSLSNSSNIVEMEFMKQGCLSPKELGALESALQLAGSKLGQNNTSERRPKEASNQSPEKLMASLESMGVRIYKIKKPNVSSSSKEISWDNFAGYDQQKRDIEDSILLALCSPEIYDAVARGTHYKFESNRPRAILFDGPPGTGKTSIARVIASQAGVPMLYVPLEIIMSKWYGEGTRILGNIFSLANQLPDGALVFLDEVDTFAGSRDRHMHEATRRTLSVLLRQIRLIYKSFRGNWNHADLDGTFPGKRIDGFEQNKKVVVIGATNRKQDLDPALISRFDSIITFDLPDKRIRKQIAALRAKHLTDSELEELATITEGMSGRDLRDVCQQTERSWASKIVRGQVSNDEEQVSLPPMQEYKERAMIRLESLRNTALEKPEILHPGTKGYSTQSPEKLMASLESMGVRIYKSKEQNVSSSSKEISWDNFAGYDQQKRDIEDSILLALRSPETYDDIARGTHNKFESNRPRAILFDGPPGTGKTSIARAIASQAGVPMLYVPLEIIMSKWYGEGTRILGNIFSLANQLPDGALVFLDEVDSFAGSRDRDMHETTRRTLSVLLRQPSRKNWSHHADLDGTCPGKRVCMIRTVASTSKRIDGFEQDKKVVVIGATNRKQDLDPALISRFDSIITFDLPDKQIRKQIAALRAKHLTDSELDELATITEGMSGRDLRDVCQQTERSWASKTLRGQVSDHGEQVNLPPMQEYKERAMIRLESLRNTAPEKLKKSYTGAKK